MAQDTSFICPLFVPADRPERYEKAAASGADGIVLDLEDAVAASSKMDARNALRTDFTDVPVVVRINAVGTPWHEEDLAAIRRLPAAAIMIPKAEMATLSACAAAVDRPVIALIETARGLAEARQIACVGNVVRLAFGSIDYCAALGTAHTRDALLLPRSELVLASNLGRLAAPLDGVTTAIDNAAVIEDDARYASSLGFGGKLCIHPRQVEAIRSGFVPDGTAIDWARRVLASGDGAAKINGEMIDEPVRIRARQILARASLSVP